MNKKELRKISFQYRTLAAQMLKMDSQEEISYIQMFYDFITKTPLLYEYVTECDKEFDFTTIFREKEWSNILVLPSEQYEMATYGYQLLGYILDGPKQLFALAHGYTRTNKISDIISSFMRKSIEPFVVNVRSYLEMQLIDCDETSSLEEQCETIFLSYCQKDSDIANIIDTELNKLIEDKAKISRDIRDVEYHSSFKIFMQSIEQHDYVIAIVSDNYLKSRNCLYEMLEVVKDSRFRDKLIFIILSDSDAKYYTSVVKNPVGAKIYSSLEQTQYTIYWKKQAEELQHQIDEIGDMTYAIAQIKEKKIITKILLDLQDFLDFIKDNKGLSLDEHISHNFEDVCDYMKIL